MHLLLLYILIATWLMLAMSGLVNRFFVEFVFCLMLYLIVGLG